MREAAVRAACYNCGVEGLKFRESVAERDDFGRANESEVQRIEEENQPTPAIIFQSYFLEVTIDDSLQKETNRIIDDSLLIRSKRDKHVQDNPPK